MVGLQQSIDGSLTLADMQLVGPNRVLDSSWCQVNVGIAAEDVGAALQELQDLIVRGIS